MTQVELTCTVGEGIDCSAYIPSPNSCLQNVAYASTFENTGSTPFDITVAESQFGSQDPVSILPFLNPTKLSAGEASSYFQERKVNFCVDQVLTYFVRGQASPEPCQDEDKYFITTKAPPTEPCTLDVSCRGTKFQYTSIMSNSHLLF